MFVGIFTVNVLTQLVVKTAIGETVRSLTRDGYTCAKTKLQKKFGKSKDEQLVLFN